MRVVATDLDDTLIWRDRVLRPRTLEALARTRAAGLDVIVVTGRMVQSLQRIMPLSILNEPAICYQGAAVVDADGIWLLHVTIDVELVAWAGYGIAVENAHPRVKAVASWVCPPAADEGVAAVLEALLDSAG